LKEEQRNWWLVGKLSPSLFTDNYLYKNGKNQVVELRECSSVFEKKLSERKEDEIMKHMEEADISHENYSKVYSRRRELSQGGVVKYRVLSEVCPYKLFDLIEKTKIKRIGEEIARYFLFQLLEVLEALHQKCVYYLTLRPEDILLDSRFNLKLSNFCIPNAIIKGGENWKKEITNKNTSLAPEMLGNNANSFEKSDIFNLGVLLFSMVVGFRPFRELNILSDIFLKHISHGDFKNYWALIQKATPKLNLSLNFKDLVFKMLNLNVDKRIGLCEIKEHPWFNSDDHGGKIIDNNAIYEFFIKLVKNDKNSNSILQNKDNKIQLLKETNKEINNNTNTNLTSTGLINTDPSSLKPL